MVFNRLTQRNNSTGFKGVTYDVGRGRYRGQVKVDGVPYRTRRHMTAEAADAELRGIRQRFHAGFVNHG